jgi:DNA-binding transcriptional LysR family regulator
MAFLLNAVRSSDALTYAPRHTIRHPDGAGIAQLDMPALTSTRDAGIVRRRSSLLSPTTRHFLAALRATCRLQPEH